MIVVAQDGLQYQRIMATPDGSPLWREGCQWPLSDEDVGERCSPTQATKESEWAAHTLIVMIVTVEYTTK